MRAQLHRDGIRVVNIFHTNDPVAYRLAPVFDPSLASLASAVETIPRYRSATARNSFNVAALATLRTPSPPPRTVSKSAAAPRDAAPGAALPALPPVPAPSHAGIARADADATGVRSGVLLPRVPSRRGGAGGDDGGDDDDDDFVMLPSASDSFPDLPSALVGPPAHAPRVTVVDCCLPTSMLGIVSSYAELAGSHKCYWRSEEVVLCVFQTVAASMTP
jgi:hypothetical protein